MKAFRLVLLERVRSLERSTVEKYPGLSPSSIGFQYPAIASERSSSSITVSSSTMFRYCLVLAVDCVLVKCAGLTFQAERSQRTTSIGGAGSLDRRTWFACILSSSTACMLLAPPVNPGLAVEASPKDEADFRSNIQQAMQALQKLLDNWEEAVVDCTYADLPRELLETKNKELLLEKATTNALFDKSVSVVSCKTTNRVVREYLGLTGKGPLVGLNQNLRAAMDAIVLSDGDSKESDPEYLMQTIEEIQQALSRADSLSYSARRDFSSINNFDPADKKSIANADLLLAKGNIETAVALLKRILALLPE